MYSLRFGCMQDSPLKNKTFFLLYNRSVQSISSFDEKLYIDLSMMMIKQCNSRVWKAKYTSRSWPRDTGSNKLYWSNLTFSGYLCRERMYGPRTLNHWFHRFPNPAISYPLVHGHSGLEMRSQMALPLLPTLKLRPTETAATSDFILTKLEELQIRIPSIPFSTPVKLVQMLPQMILTAKGPFQQRPLRAGLELVRLKMFVARRGVATENALGTALFKAPNDWWLVGRQWCGADP